MTPPVLVIPPVETPISVADVRLRGRVGDDVPSALIQAMIEAATARLDGYSGLLGRCLVDQTWEVGTGNRYDSSYRLPFAPISSMAIRYVGTDGSTMTLPDGYARLEMDAIGPRVSLSRGYAWPLAAFDGAGLTISFVAGYGDATKVPAPIREAIHLYTQQLLDTAIGSGLIRTETVEGIGSTGYFTPEEASAGVVKLADDMIRPYCRGKI